MLTFRKIEEITRAYQNFKRYEQIIGVLIRYGAGDYIEAFKPENIIRAGMSMLTGKDGDKAKDLEQKSWPEKIRLVCEELGPTFVKLGQILSTRPDLIPISLASELSRLQDNVPSFPYEQVRSIIQSELGGLPEEVFAAFEERPFAAASIGQAHRAVLKTGEEVVVKVQRPGVKKIIETDLEIMYSIAALMERHLLEFQIQKPTLIIQEFARSIEKEINYKTESFNMSRFRKQFEKDETIRVPRVFAELVTEKVLVMEFMKGIKSSDIDAMRATGCDLKLLAHRGADLIMKQVFEHGFFHADPHPGNILVLPDNVICLLDFGMMGRVSETEREDFASMLVHLTKRDEKNVTARLLCFTHSEEEPEFEDLQRDVGDIMDEHLLKPLKDVCVGDLLEDFMNMLTKHRLRLSPNLYMMIKALISIEKLGKRLDPELDIITVATPYVRKLQLEKLRPSKIIKNLFEPALDMLKIAQTLPRDIRSLITKTRRGELRIEFKHNGLAPLVQSLNNLANHVSFAIVVAALIIGSSLITLSGIPPKWYDVPVIGVFGFVFSGVLGFWLLLSIFRRGRML